MTPTLSVDAVQREVDLGRAGRRRGRGRSGVGGGRVGRRRHQWRVHRGLDLGGGQRPVVDPGLVDEALEVLAVGLLPPIHSGLVVVWMAPVAAWVATWVPLT